MVVKSDQQRLKSLLSEAITVLCKNGLQYKAEFQVEGLIGITLDNDDVFLININETIKSEKELRRKEQAEQCEPVHTSTQSKEEEWSHTPSPSRTHHNATPSRKRTAMESEASGSESQSSNLDPHSVDSVHRNIPDEGSGDYSNSANNTPSNRSPTAKRKYRQNSHEDSKDDIIIIKEEGFSGDEMDSSQFDMSQTADFSGLGGEHGMQLQEMPGCSSWDPTGSYIPGFSEQDAAQAHMMASLSNPPQAKNDENCEGHISHIPVEKTAVEVFAEWTRCPLCSSGHDTFNSNKKLRTHITQVHDAHSVSNFGIKILGCKLGCRESNIENRMHYHCSRCPHIGMRKPDFLCHMKFHMVRDRREKKPGKVAKKKKVPTATLR